MRWIDIQIAWEDDRQDRIFLSIESEQEMNRVDDVVAERYFHFVDDPKRRARVIVGRPRIVDDGEYKCSYQILGVGDEEVRTASGIDGIQALQLVLTKAIPAWLARLHNEHPNLRWEDADGGDFGFGV